MWTILFPSFSIGVGRVIETIVFEKRQGKWSRSKLAHVTTLEIRSASINAPFVPRRPSPHPVKYRETFSPFLLKATVNVTEVANKYNSERLIGGLRYHCILII